MSNTFSVTVTSTESNPTLVSAQYATIMNGALILSDDPPFQPGGADSLQVSSPKAIYATGQWQSAIASTGAST